MYTRKSTVLAFCLCIFCTPYFFNKLNLVPGMLNILPLTIEQGSKIMCRVFRRNNSTILYACMCLRIHKHFFYLLYIICRHA